MLSSNRVTATLTGADQWTAELSCPPGLADMSIIGTFVGDLTLQKSLDGGQSWGAAHVFTSSDEAVVESGSGCLLRAGFPAGGYTSGSAAVILAAEAM